MPPGTRGRKHITAASQQANESFQTPIKKLGDTRETIRNEGIALAQSQKQRLAEGGTIILNGKKSISLALDKEVANTVSSKNVQLNPYGTPKRPQSKIGSHSNRSSGMNDSFYTNSSLISN